MPSHGSPGASLCKRAVLLLAMLFTGSLHAIDVTQAAVLAPSLQKPMAKAVQMFREESEKRSGVAWRLVTNRSDAAGPVIAIGTFSTLQSIFPEALKERNAGPPDGFQVFMEREGGHPILFIAGNDPRGTLFGVGFVLRHIRFVDNRVLWPDRLEVQTSPAYPLRGHQLGYRPKTNSYDAWDVARWEQYFRDLIIFGANAVELIPPRSDDDSTSPHFPLPPMKMMIEMSRLADEYGLDLWIWYPAMDRNYGDARTVESALREWGDVFRQLPKISAVFVPGGDPGHTQPGILLNLLEKQRVNLRQFHPNAQMWVSPQSFNEAWLEEFLGILNREQPAWLDGVVYGPQVRISIQELRKRIPARYPIRNYPDITHSWRCEYPVPDWDGAFALTLGREPINPRPHGMANIFRLSEPETAGFITYSEGCNDDVNKAVWSALGWDPARPVEDILRDYARYFFGDEHVDRIVRGLVSLEENWRGPILLNRGIRGTLKELQPLEHDRKLMANWRAQQILYRAYYDAYVASRLNNETQLQKRAMGDLKRARRIGVDQALSQAERWLGIAESDPIATGWRKRIFELAEQLYRSIGMQLSVSKYKAIGLERGANLDSLDEPLNDRRWLRVRFEAIRKMTNSGEQFKAIDEIVNWTDPGPGGFYDDLGNAMQQPHLVRSREAWNDPRFMKSPLTSFGYRQSRMSWWTHEETLFETPLELFYPKLDRTAQYRLRIVYAGDSFRKKVRLTANDSLEIHPLQEKPFPVRPLEFDLPREATRGGSLNLKWEREPGLGDNGRGCQVAEVWLIKK